MWWDRRWTFTPTVEDLARGRAAPDDRIQLAAQATRLIDDPVLALMFERVAADLTTTWKNSRLGDNDSREAAYRQLWALEAVRSKLRSAAGDGKLLKAERERQG